MNQLENILAEKAASEKHEILIRDLADMEKELALWQAWLVMNEGAFTYMDVAGVLNRAKQIVNELLITE